MRGHYVPGELGSVAPIVIRTIQRLYSMLEGETEMDPVLEEGSQFGPAGVLPIEPVPITCNPAIPVEFFDFVIIDEVSPLHLHATAAGR